MLRGLCEPTRLLDFVENFTLFSCAQEWLVKAHRAEPSDLGVNNAIRATLARVGRAWARRCLLADARFRQKLCDGFLRAEDTAQVPGIWPFAIVTYRVELDEQIAKTFAACGAVSDANVCHAETGAELRELFAGKNRYVFTLIHKFQTPQLLCDRRDVIVLTDEATARSTTRWRSTCARHCLTRSSWRLPVRL